MLWAFRWNEELLAEPVATSPRLPEVRMHNYLQLRIASF